MESSAFSDRTRVPTGDELAAALGPAAEGWHALLGALALEFAPLAERWTFAGARYGWSLRLAHRGRPVVYLTPLAGRFRVAFALPERAMPAALAADLSEPVRAIVATAPAYVEGRGVRIEVMSEADVASILALARIRMAS